MRLAGTVDTVKHLTNLPINYLITVNFHGFKEIVDKIGGIWLDVDRRYYHVNNGTAAENYANINIQPGYQLLTGEQALDVRPLPAHRRRLPPDRAPAGVRARAQAAVRAQLQLARAAVDRARRSTTNVEVGGNAERQDGAESWLLFALTLPGGHFFQDRIAGRDRRQR